MAGIVCLQLIPQVAFAYNLYTGPSVRLSVHLSVHSQARMEEQEEHLSQMVHGSHLRATRPQIVAAAKDLVHLCSRYTSYFSAVAERCLQRTRAPATPPPDEEEEEVEVIAVNPYVNAFLQILIAHLEQS